MNKVFLNTIGEKVIVKGGGSSGGGNNAQVAYYAGDVRQYVWEGFGVGYVKYLSSGEVIILDRTQAILQVEFDSQNGIDTQMYAMCVFSPDVTIPKLFDGSDLGITPRMMIDAFGGMHEITEAEFFDLTNLHTK